MVNGLISASDIANIKASGVTTKIVDATRRPNIIPQGQVRLIYGSSKVGVFNRCVFIEAGDFKNADEIYGGEDKQLERKGSFFHRALNVALEEGAVLALALLKTNDETDELTGEPTPNSDIAEYKSFSVAPANSNFDKTKKLYSSYFRKDRFWNPDERYLLATRDILHQGSILNLANISQKKMTFIVKKSTVVGFDVTVKEWYQNREIPAFLREGDFISDYFVDIYVIAGDFSNYATLSTDPIMGKYFDKKGLITSQLDAFLALGQVALLKFFQGCLIPNFVDKDGSIKAIDRIINSGTDFHGVLCAIDKDELDKFADQTNTKSFDLVGHSFLSGNVSNIDMLSYKRQFSADREFEMSFPTSFNGINTSIGYSAVSLTTKHTVTITSTNPDFASLTNLLEDGTLIKGILTQAGIDASIPYTNPVMKISNISKTATTITFDLTNELKQYETSLTGSYVDILVEGSAVPFASASGFIQITSFSPSVVGSYEIKVVGLNNIVSFGTISFTLLSTQATVTQDIANLINSGTGTHGYIAVWDTVDKVDITHNGSDGSTHAGDSFDVSLLSGSATTFYNFGTMAGGNLEIEAGIQYDHEVQGFYNDGTNSKCIVREYDDLYVAWASGDIKDGDRISTGVGSYRYLKFTPTKDLTTFENILEVEFYTDADLSVSTSFVFGGTSYNSYGYKISTFSVINIIASDVEISRNFPILSEISQNVFRVDYSYFNDIKVGQMLEGIDVNENPILVRITSIKNVGSPAPTEMEVTTSGVIKYRPAIGGGKTVNRFLPFAQLFDHLQAYYLKGLEIKESHMPNNTNARMKEIISVMIETPIRKALVDSDMVTFRYAVDTFNHGIEAQAKRDIARLLRDRSKAMGLMNMPSTRELEESGNPSFKDAPTASSPLQPLKAKYIAEGGNKDMNPDFLMSRPEEEDGASHTVFFYPNIVKQDVDYSVVSVPPAIYVSNNYVRKWRNGDGFKATAGTSRGVITGENLLGLDHELDKDDRGELETKGINPLRQLEDGTIIIYGNQTGYHKFRSILNQANSRDTLITIEIDSENILNGFVFENAFSDDIIRETIKTSLSNYYTSLRDQFKAIESFEVRFDRKNNPDWVVSESASIVDVELKLPNVTRKFISRITLVGGSASVGAFVAV